VRLGEADALLPCRALRGCFGRVEGVQAAWPDEQWRRGRQRGGPRHGDGDAGGDDGAAGEDLLAVAAAQLDQALERPSDQARVRQPRH